MIPSQCIKGSLPKRGYCIICTENRTRAPVRGPKKPLQPLSVNSLRGNPGAPRGRPSYTKNGCVTCEKSLYDRYICWQSHRSSYRKLNPFSTVTILIFGYRGTCCYVPAHGPLLDALPHKGIWLPEPNGWLSQAAVQAKRLSKLGGCSNRWLSEPKGQPKDATSQIWRPFSQCISMGHRGSVVSPRSEPWHRKHQMKMSYYCWNYHKSLRIRAPLRSISFWHLLGISLILLRICSVVILSYSS